MKKSTQSSNLSNLAYGEYYSLPRGGHIVRVSQGVLQVGVPPETIKDSILLFNDVPNIYCIGDQNFCFIKGLNLSELEFPIYYNFFIKKRKIFIIGTKKNCDVFRKMMNLVLFGKGPVDMKLVNADYSKNAKYKPPNMKKEISFFANFTIDDMITFKTFDKNFNCVIESMHVHKEPSGFKINDLDEQGKHFSVQLPSFDKYQDFYKKPLIQINHNGFERPQFGVTVLGASHGFDPQDNTSGFIFWHQGRGVIVDPPANFTDQLNQEEINPLAITSMVLTHVHADHDSGVFQKILEQSRVTLYTTNTIMRLWLYKYSLITGLSINEIKKMFNFIPVKIGEPVEIEGLEFSFRYMFHSLPTIGFDVKNKGFTITFSSDHLNQPSFFRQLLNDNFIDEERYNEFLDFPWGSDLIFHEAGIPPLHTSIEYLNSLSNEIKKKTFVYHIAKENFIEKTTLTRCITGLKNTMVLNIRSKSILNKKRANFLGSLPIFKRFNIDKNKWELLLKEKGIVEIITLPKGNALIPDDFSQHFYIVKKGLLNLHHGVLNTHKLNPIYLFNDCSIIYLTDYSNPATINNLPARVKTVLFKINREKFFTSVHHLFKISINSIKKELEGLTCSLNFKAWEVLEKSNLLTLLTPYQRIEFLNVLEQVNVVGDKSINYDLEKQSFFYHSGKVLSKNKTLNLHLGEFIGDTSELVFNKTVPAKKSKSSSKNIITIVPGSTLFRINKSLVKLFYKEHPGVKYRFPYR